MSFAPRTRRSGMRRGEVMEAGVNAARSHWPRRGRWVRRPSERRMWGPTADPTVGAASAACSTRILRRFNGVTVGGREPSWLVRLAGWAGPGRSSGEEEASASRPARPIQWPPLSYHPHLWKVFNFCHAAIVWCFCCCQDILRPDIESSLVVHGSVIAS